MFQLSYWPEREIGGALLIETTIERLMPDDQSANRHSDHGERIR